MNFDSSMMCNTTVPCSSLCHVVAINFDSSMRHDTTVPCQNLYQRLLEAMKWMRGILIECDHIFKFKCKSGF